MANNKIINIVLNIFVMEPANIHGPAYYMQTVYYKKKVNDYDPGAILILKGTVSPV
jgi:hypothetical protein